MVRVRPSIILLKDPLAAESLIPIFQRNGKHFFDINSMINCSLVKLLIKRVRLVSMSTRITRMGTHEILCVFILVRVL